MDSNENHWKLKTNKENIKQYKDSLPPILHALAELFSCGIDTTIAPAPIPILRAHLKLFEALVINTNLTPEISPMLFKLDSWILDVHVFFPEINKIHECWSGTLVKQH